MRWRLTPARRRGVEILDDPSTPSAVRARSMEDVARANALFGGARAALRGFRRVVPHLPRRAVLLDVGTGLADIPIRAVREAQAAGVTLTTLGVDAAESLLRSSRQRLGGGVVGDALRLPVADASADVVTCSQLLHHFAEEDVRRAIAELHRVSRAWVVISDLRRSWLAAAGFWLASIALGFHPVTRHDGVASVLRGFTAGELRRLVSDATGVEPSVERTAFWRLSATWKKR
jgi:2-polyprenyl-3-methyl-5-hydroxy-6-metoxy-1,4-benzoquinol methylase